MFEIREHNILISTDKSKLQINVIHHYLSNYSYWAVGIPIQTVQKSIDNSIAFGVYLDKDDTVKQIGFCRVVSDLATYAYLADVFILEDFRGKGLSKLLVEKVLKHPDLQGLRRWVLATKDAHGLYAQYGFTALDQPENFMQIKVENPYQV
ncbi:MAG: GNAT family N-acetyltransferase [Arcicella sp.]|jgi:GNAT superfamily N-acetyltransferase|nr:GNAT family N-acetyltransferase [Arcicella sp.]